MIYISQQAPRASMKDIANQNTNSTAPTGNSNINFFLRHCQSIAPQLQRWQTIDFIPPSQTPRPAATTALEHEYHSGCMADILRWIIYNLTLLIT